jgi:hypothetical protein
LIHILRLRHSLQIVLQNLGEVVYYTVRPLSS